MDLSFLDPLMEALRKFKEDVTPLLNTLKDLGSWVLENVLIPLADWAANSVLPAFLEILGGAFLALNDALLFLQPAAQWLWDNVLQPIAEWTGGVFVDVLTAISSWIQEHHETLGKVVAVVTACFVAVEALSIALKVIPAILGALTSPVTLVVAAIAGLVALFVELYDSCDGFREGVDQVWQGIKDVFSAGIEFVKALFQGDWAGMDAAWAKMSTAAKSLWEGYVNGLKAGWEWCKEKIAAIWNKIIEKFKDIFGIHSPSTLFAEFGRYMMEGLVLGIKNAISLVTNACNQIWAAIKNVFASVGTWFKDTFTAAWKNVKDVFSTGGKIFDGIKDGIAGTFKTIVNGLITGINKVIAVPFNSINGLLNTVRGTTILGISPFKNLWSYNPLSVPQIPKLAVGGIVNRPGRGVPAIIGEAGAEAVLPLENNTEWMDILAEKIGGNVTIPIYMDGKKIYTYMVDIGKRKAFAANGG
jgi:phage-related protein